MHGIEAVLLAVGLPLDEEHLLREPIRCVGFLRVAVPEVVFVERNRRELRIRADRADADELGNTGEARLFHQLHAHHEVFVRNSPGFSRLAPMPPTTAAR